MITLRLYGSKPVMNNFWMWGISSTQGPSINTKLCARCPRLLCVTWGGHISGTFTLKCQDKLQKQHKVPVLKLEVLEDYTGNDIFLSTQSFFMSFRGLRPPSWGCEAEDPHHTEMNSGWMSIGNQVLFIFDRNPKRLMCLPVTQATGGKCPHATCSDLLGGLIYRSKEEVLCCFVCFTTIMPNMAEVNPGKYSSDCPLCLFCSIQPSTSNIITIFIKYQTIEKQLKSKMFLNLNSWKTFPQSPNIFTTLLR